MALFYAYHRLVIPRFAYTKCQTTPEKLCSAIGQIVIGQSILIVDAVVTTAGVSLASGCVMTLLGVPDSFTFASIVCTGGSLYIGLSTCSAIYPILSTGLKLYRGRMFMVTLP